jgi:uncharacterized coiled-coil protein SlyX
MLENDIYDLQIKISYLEGFVTDLNSVIIEQNKTNSLLKREIELLKSKVDQLEERIENKGSEFKADEAPPHY